MPLDEKIRFLKHRIISLKPPGEIPLNPVSALCLLNRHQWALWTFAFLCRTWVLKTCELTQDGFDFFTVSLTIDQISNAFASTPSKITWGITVTLMLRCVGAVIFGYLGDRFGRKWPFAVDLTILVALELGSGFVQNVEQFVIVRAVFGIAMGGMFGNVSAIALEDSPMRARGILSGLLQEGYALGYLLAAVVNDELTKRTSWRAMFWVAAGPPALLAIWRVFLPETEAFKEIKRNRKAVSDEAILNGMPQPYVVVRQRSLTCGVVA
jgi:SHS family lactate transporter-like MFS transporter